MVPVSGIEVALKIFEHSFNSCSHSRARNFWPQIFLMIRWSGVKSAGANRLNEVMNFGSSCPTLVKFKPPAPGCGMRNAAISLKLDLTCFNVCCVSGNSIVTLEAKRLSTACWFCIPYSISPDQSRIININFWNAASLILSDISRPYSVSKWSKSVPCTFSMTLKHWTEESTMLIVKQALLRWLS